MTDHNYRCPREDQIVVSIGLHWGTVLTNGKLVTGPAVPAVARIAELAEASQLLLSQHALHRIPKVTQTQCTPVGGSVGDEPELYALPWGDERGLARQVRVEDAAEQLVLPARTSSRSAGSTRWPTAPGPTTSC